MKIISLTIKNIGKIADETIKLDKPLILFYGQIRAGKSTILNAVKWCLGGAFPSDIIRHGSREARVCIVFDGGSISREWYIAKDQTTKAKSVQFIRDGKLVDKPAAEIAKLLNPFQLNQDHLRNMGEAERKAFLVDLFAVKTDDLDDEAARAEATARELRAKIKGYGDIDLTPVEAVPVDALMTQREAVVKAHTAQVAAWTAEYQAAMRRHADAKASVKVDNDAIEKYNQTVEGVMERRAERSDAFKTQAARVAELKRELLAIEQAVAMAQEAERKDVVWLAAHTMKHLKAEAPAPDTSELQRKMYSSPDTAAIDAKIGAAGAAAVKFEQFQRNKTRAAARRTDELQLLTLEARQRDIKKERAARLQGISQQSGIANLEFDEAGNVVYEGTSAGMLSTSQVQRLSTDLSGLYPPGMGVEILDRGESLGQSIFDYVEIAKKRSTTILATIVGEKPAAIPAEIGVFVVNDGRVERQL